MQEKPQERRFPRVKPDVSVEYNVSSSAAEGTRETHLLDMSANGISFSVPGPIPEKTVLKMQMTVPGIDHIITAVGHVVRNFTIDGEHSVAVEINSIDYDDFITLLDYTLSGYDLS